MSDTGKAADLLAQIPAGEKRGLPPVHLWNPPFCGDLDMRIARMVRGTTWAHRSASGDGPAVFQCVAT